MTDDFDAFVRDRLAGEGRDWAPVRAMESTRAELTGRVRRRRRRGRTSMVIGAMAVAVLAFALVHLNSTAAGRQLDANPSAPAIGAGPSGPAPGAAAGAPGSVPLPAGRHPTGGDAQPGRPPGGTPSAGFGDRPGPPSVLTPVTTPTGTVAGTAPPTGSSVAPTLPPVTEPGSTGPPPTPSPPPATTIPPDATTVPTSPTTTPAEYVFTNSDSGLTESVTTGARIELDLAGCPGTLWGPVVTTNPHVVAPASSAPDPVAGSARAFLTATGPGQAILRVLAVSACATPAAPFRLVVDVSGHPTAS